MISLSLLGCGDSTILFPSGTGGVGGDAGTGGAPVTTSSSTGVTTSTTTAMMTTTGMGGSGGIGGTGGGTTTTTTTTTSITCTGALQHVCDGMCVENTPQTGCATSVDCTPCTVPPHGTIATCDQGGHCDFGCQPGYEKQFKSCKCKTDCCENSDCPSGKTCNTGVCVGPGCDPAECNALCLAQCMLQNKVGSGVCTMGFDPVCNCVCF